jgi:hypothetical protein
MCPVPAMSGLPQTTNVTGSHTVKITGLFDYNAVDVIAGGIGGSIELGIYGELGTNVNVQIGHPTNKFPALYIAEHVAGRMAPQVTLKGCNFVVSSPTNNVELHHQVPVLNVEECEFGWPGGGASVPIRMMDDAAYYSQIRWNSQDAGGTNILFPNGTFLSGGALSYNQNTRLFNYWSKNGNSVLDVGTYYYAPSNTPIARFGEWISDTIQAGFIFEVTSNYLPRLRGTAGSQILADHYGNGSGLTNITATVSDASSLSFTVKKNAGNIAKAQPVYVVSGASSTPYVDIASCTNANMSRVVGLAVTAMTSAADFQVRRGGVLTGITMAGAAINPLGETWAEGNLLFLTQEGGMSTNRPTAGRSVKCAYVVSVTGGTCVLLCYPFENPVWSTAATNENVVLRVGDSVGVNKVSVRNYTNTEVASIDSKGVITGNGSGLTNLNAANLASGTVPGPRLTAPNSVTLSYSGGTNIAVNASLGTVFYLLLTNAAWVNAITSGNPGETITVEQIQDATGTWSVGYNTNCWKFPSGSYYSVATNANAVSLISGIVDHTGTNVLVNQGFDYR